MSPGAEVIRQFLSGKYKFRLKNDSAHPQHLPYYQSSSHRFWSFKERCNVNATIDHEHDSYNVNDEESLQITVISAQNEK